MEKNVTQDIKQLVLFFNNKEINSSSIIDSLSGKSISQFILSNKNSVSIKIKEICQ
jgi:hypothetical protein